MAFETFAFCSFIQSFHITSPPAFAFVGLGFQILLWVFFKGFAAGLCAEVVIAPPVINKKIYLTEGTFMPHTGSIMAFVISFIEVFNCVIAKPPFFFIKLRG